MLVSDDMNLRIYSGGKNITALLRRDTNSESQISLRGCWTKSAARDIANSLGNGATVSGTWFWAISVKGTFWIIAPYWSYSHNNN